MVHQGGDRLAEGVAGDPVEASAVEGSPQIAGGVRSVPDLGERTAEHDGRCLSMCAVSSPEQLNDRVRQRNDAPPRGALRTVLHDQAALLGADDCRVHFEHARVQIYSRPADCACFADAQSGSENEVDEVR